MLNLGVSVVRGAQQDVGNGQEQQRRARANQRQGNSAEMKKTVINSKKGNKKSWNTKNR